MHESLSNCLKHTTIPGVNHIRTAKTKRRKVFWLVLLMTGIGGFVTNLVLILQHYLTNPILINHLIDNEPFMWPDLTFCNPTAPFPVHKSPQAIRHWNNVVKKSRGIAEFLSTRSRFFKIAKEYSSPDLETEELTLALSTLDPAVVGVDDFQSSVIFYGYTSQPSGIYMSTEFGGAGIQVEIKNVKELYSTQFVQFLNNIPCQTFKINESSSIELQNVDSIMFILKFNSHSYQIINSSYIFRSMYMYINQHNHLPQRDSVTLLPGFDNEVIITQSRYERNSNKRPCRHQRHSSEIFDAMLSKLTKYEGSFDDCRKKLSQQLYLAACSCYNPFLPIIHQPGQPLPPRLCLNASLFDRHQILANVQCLSAVYDRYHSRHDFESIEAADCGAFRVFKCNDVVYSIDHRKEMWIDLWSKTFNDRRRRFFQDSYEPLFKRHWSGRNYVKEMRDDVALLVVKRKSRSGDLFREDVEYPVSELVSDVGGLMGLWLGLSVVGLIEIGEFLSNVASLQLAALSPSSPLPLPTQPADCRDQDDCQDDDQETTHQPSSSFHHKHDFQPTVNGCVYPIVYTDENGRYLHSIISSF